METSSGAVITRASGTATNSAQAPGHRKATRVPGRKSTPAPVVTTRPAPESLVPPAGSYWTTKSAILMVSAMIGFGGGPRVDHGRALSEPQAVTPIAMRLFAMAAQCAERAMPLSPL
jgi:hypothetical protein